jgi:hypothetical protein
MHCTTASDENQRADETPKQSTNEQKETVTSYPTYALKPTLEIRHSSTIPLTVLGLIAAGASR